MKKAKRLKAYKIKYGENSFKIVFAYNSLEIIRKYDLCSKTNINTRLIELSGEQEAIAFSNRMGDNE